MLELKNIRKSYKVGSKSQVVLKDINLKFRNQEFAVILGPSGSGKTTLLNIIGGLDQYDSGDLIINNRSTKKFKENDFDAYRNHSIGFVFQGYHLISPISVFANVEIGLQLSGIPMKKSRKKAKEILKHVGLKEHIYKKPNELSGGQKQRVAIARALATNPDIILADEPTGALDTQTAIQIMEILKKISKEKLIIMVTHNEDLAKTYATRVIELQDGKVLHDSNPIEENEKVKQEYKIRRTSMPYKEALNLSLNNLKTKKGRTLLTAFASSIGIIGIAIILSLSNGFHKQIEILEKNTISTMPITISEVNLEESDEPELQDSKENYPNIEYVIPGKTNEKSQVHKNRITENFIKYIEEVNPKIIHELSYRYYTNFNFLNKINEKVERINLTNKMITSPKNLKNESIVNEKYDILAGREAQDREEIALVVDSNNTVTEDLLTSLGLDSQKEALSFDEILNQELKLVMNDEFYAQVGDYFAINTDLEKIYNDEKTMTLKVVGILRLKEEYFNLESTSYFMNTESLLEYVISKNKDSEIIKKQKETNYNVLTGEMFDLATEEAQDLKKQMLAYLGDSALPFMIQLYPTDFEAKKELLEYLDKYNEGKENQEKIVYIDQAKIMTSLSENVMDSVTIILIAFSGISLFVSSIMIGIIMYISVLERTKEIGILRSLGARRKDIKRVFNAEAFLIGLSSGILGILTTRFLLISINQILYHFMEIKNLAVLNPKHALVLIFISITLTRIGGTLPAKIASKKNPVVALRTE